MEFDFDHLPECVMNGPAIADNGEATAAAGPSPAAAAPRLSSLEILGRDPLDEIAMLMRAMTYGKHVTMAAGILQLAGIKPDFGAQHNLEQLLHRWAQNPPTDPPIAHPSAPVASSSPQANEAALFPATGVRPRRSRRKQQTEAASASRPSDAASPVATMQTAAIDASAATGPSSAASPPNPTTAE